METNEDTEVGGITFEDPENGQEKPEDSAPNLITEHSIGINTNEHQRMHVAVKAIRKLTTQRYVHTEDDIEDLELARDIIVRATRRLRKLWDENQEKVNS